MSPSLHLSRVKSIFHTAAGMAEPTVETAPLTKSHASVWLASQCPASGRRTPRQARGTLASAWLSQRLRHGSASA
ncbi:hypothetical protein [Anaerolinea sp.]|uniref:hypothetical protein n=1 Tax=Anaerolinea sp. TaxID=1872519 RepID=UPI002ACE4FE0|nr:hypothetical protein [Anaerolinea sp.]